MLPKKNRAGTKEVERIFKQGRFLTSPNLTFKFIQTNKPSPPQVSFIAPKSVAKLAVKRNSLRRKGYAVLGKYIKELPKGFIGAFVFKKYQEDVSILEHEIKNILSKFR